MNFKACLLLLLASPSWASRRPVRLPEAAEVLRKTLEPQAKPYEGVVTVDVFAGGRQSTKQVRVRWAGPGRYRREVLDEAGAPAQTVISDGQTEWIYDRSRNKVWEGEPPDPGNKRLGPEEEAELLASNYEAAISTAERVAGRQVWKLELLSKATGQVERRLWVDKRYGLVLESEVFRPDGAPASVMRFSRVKFSRTQAAAWFKFSPPHGAVLVKRLEPDYLALGEAKSVSGMEPKTPAWLPSGYVFESLDVLPRGAKHIIHYRYSDGINVLSLFQCPPRVRLDFGAKKGEKVRLASGSGTLAWAPEGEVLGWSAGRSKFVLVGPLTAETLERIAESIQ